MKKDTFLCWGDRIINSKLPKYQELPTLELYMDQVIVLMEEYLAAFVIDPKDKIITPAMINNYVKHGAIPAPIKKKYNRIHLVYLLIISLMKQIMPINLIKDMIEIQLKEYSIEELLDVFEEKYFRYFEQIYMIAKNDLNEQKNKKMAEHNIEFNLAISANIYKLLVDKLSYNMLEENKTEEDKK